ncbi:aldehyde dehydrogenase family protein [Sphingopyxis sp. PAMC25046]|uniref:aldehyde dehydrogenase family protein n=1 Tax=Sphingopyxis sp. PAMC25046 TaxID=2565556 RepID=UPI00109E1443|nr:aldehyde dehydrogenase family protein [Sphingopyxis sp. PAMC25046]QCB53864.1 aldehyde dehydrogenase family protein [Sphingopyxis sp. PAMC25046]
MLEAQRAAFFADLPVSLGVRRDRLGRAMLMIEENADALCAALAADQTNQDVESARRSEVVPALAVLRAARNSVGQWMRPETEGRLLARLWGGGDYVEYLPVGVIGISAPASLALLQVATVLAGAFAAGNRIMLKFDTASPRLGELIDRLAPGFFDPLELAVASDAAFAGRAFDLLVTSEEQGDGVTIARSGKSPVIFGRSADFARAADKVIADKRVRGGRLPLAPDYLLVPDEQEEAIAAWLWRAAMQPAANEAAPTAAEQARWMRLLDDARARGGEVMTARPRGTEIPLHIVRHASEDMLVMQEDVEGPILPLCNYARIEDAIATIHRRTPPHAIYYFGRDGIERRHVLGRTLSSAIAIDGRALSPVTAGADMTLNIGSGEAGFRRFSRTRRVCRPPFFGLATRFAIKGGDDLSGPAPALH